MAKLYFFFAPMNSGKSIEILKIANNYEERGGKVMLFTSSLDNRSGVGKISSRIGIKREAIPVEEETKIFEIVKKENPNAVLVDEAQFMSEPNILQFCTVVDILEIPVMCYGLKTDFQSNLFEGSSLLLRYADEIKEIKTLCWKCDRKACFNMRIDSEGKKIKEGEQVSIGGNESYIPVCRKHFFEG